MNNKTRLQRAALKYQRRGLAIIPIGANKRPLFSWKKYTTKIPTRKQIKAWWIKYPYANIGIITGKISNLTVVDIEAGGNIDAYPDTLVCQTGGGGYHFYYRYTEQLKNKVRIKELTDIRNDSGYVVAPPSVHQSGKRYKWYIRKKIAPFPSHLFYEKSIEEAKSTEWDDILDGVKAGERNATAAKVCGLFLTKSPYSLWEKIAWPAVKNWNQQNQPPLSENELREVYQSISGRISYHQTDTEQEVKSLSDVTKDHSKLMKARRTGELTGIATGFEKIDHKLNGGFKKGDFIVIGARPSSGKTALALSFAFNAAKAGSNVLFFSIEMSALDIYDRLLAFVTKRCCSDIIQGNIKKKLLLKAYKRVRQLPLSLVELSRATSSQVIEVVKSQLIISQIDLIVVDYLQFLRDESQNNSDAVRVGKISKNLKMLARMTNIPVIAPAQLSRKTDYRATQNPRLSDLRDSGNIEADADIVMLLHRLHTTEHQENAILDIAKNRKGETGAMRLRFDTRTTRFHEYG